MKLQVGNPTENGMYVCYVSGVFERFPDKLMLMWFDGKWVYPSSDQNYRMGVEGWVGPLPSPTQNDLNTMQFRNLHCEEKYAYAIGKKIGQYTDGPYFDINELLGDDGYEGDYIYKLGGEKDRPVMKWNESSMKWVKVVRKRRRVRRKRKCN